MSMPKPTDNWDRRKERRCRRRGSIGKGAGWASTKSRSHPLVFGKWREVLVSVSSRSDTETDGRRGSGLDVEG